MVRLRNIGLSRPYRRSLLEAGRALLRRLAQRGYSVTKQTPAQTLDRMFEAAVEDAHREGVKLYWVTLGVVALQRAFNVSGTLLKGAWRAIQGWRSLQPVRSRIPITAQVLYGLFVFGLREGWREDGFLRAQIWGCVLALWLGFACLLRPGEILQLRVRDVSFSTASSSTLFDPGMVLVVRTPKTRRVCHKQFVLCSDVRLERWLRWWLQGLSPRAPLFPFSRYIWTKHFTHLLQQLGLQDIGYTLGSVRAGGATHHFRQHANLGQLQFLGRWSSASTMQFYLQEAFSAHVEARFSAATLEKLNLLNQHSFLLSSPPIQSPFSLFGARAHVRARRDRPAGSLDSSSEGGSQRR